MGSLKKEFWEAAKKVKDIYDQELFGESSERVTITWGKGNKIGFDKPVSLSIEDALQEIINTQRSRAKGELIEFDDSDMPTLRIEDFNDPEKFAAHKKAMDEWDERKGWLKVKN